MIVITKRNSMQDPNFQIKTDVEKPGYGVFIVEPLEQGYGQTLGNSLRRVLLSSLPGSAVAAVKIKGVQHQYTTIAGVKEDVLEFILNIKKLRLQLEGSDEAKITIRKKTGGDVTGADIETTAGVTVVNPDLYLCHVSDKKETFECEIAVKRGYGYVTSDEHQIDEVGVIAVDSLFTPVTRVNYRVEQTRVGRMTNLDKLVMEIWTDGTITPLAALKASGKILVTYFMQVVEPKAQGISEPVAVTPAISDEVLKMRIEELDVPTRIVNALANGGIETVGQLLGTQRADLMKIKNLGGKSLGVVEDKLREKGVALNV